jgi:hypothetical protein
LNNSSTPNLKAFKYQNTQNKFQNVSKQSDETGLNWVNINDSIVLESDNEEVVEQKKAVISNCDLDNDDDDEDDFAFLKKEKKRKFNNLMASNQSPSKNKSYSVDENEIVDRSIEELDFDFDENLDFVNKDRKKFNKK